MTSATMEYHYYRKKTKTVADSHPTKKMSRDLQKHSKLLENDKVTPGVKLTNNLKRLKSSRHSPLSLKTTQTISLAKSNWKSTYLTLNSTLVLFCVLTLFSLPLTCRCQTEIDECLSSPCMNNATCIDLLDGFMCNCSANFTGDLCQVAVSISVEICVAVNV